MAGIVLDAAVRVHMAMIVLGSVAERLNPNDPEALGHEADRLEKVAGQLRALKHEMDEARFDAQDRQWAARARERVTSPARLPGDAQGQAIP